MSSYVWAKVFIEVLEDPKMGRLSDDLWRRIIELILLAKQYNKGGFLPGAADMSWSLRIPVEQLEADLEKISKIGADYDPPRPILEIRDGNWFLTNYNKRQAEMPVKERVANYRKRNVTQLSNDSVTKGYTEEEVEVEVDTETDKTKSYGAKKPRQRDPLFDAICSVCSQVDAKVKGNGAKIGKARAALADSEPPYTAEEVLRFGEWWNSDSWRKKKGPPSVWQLIEQIGIVRNGNGRREKQKPMTPDEQKAEFARLNPKYKRQAP